MKNYLLSLFLLCSVSSVIDAQDIHYSQFFNSPLNINPALTGVNNGDQRFQANYRNQWSNVPVDYLTFSAAYDQPITDRFDSTGYWSLGGLFNYDRAGDLNFQNLGMAISGSYSYKLTPSFLVSPGIALAFNQRSFDFNAIRSGNQWNGESFDGGIAAEVFDTDANSFVDVSAGLNLRYHTSYRTYVDFGGGLFHLLTPAQGYDDTSADDKIKMRFNAYAMSSFYASSKLDVLLNALYSTQDVYQEIVLNAQGKIYLNKNRERNTALFLGLGLRLNDAWYPMIALQKGRWYASASYDFNTSDFDVATNGRGGLELSLRYLFTKVPLTPLKPCPIY